MGIVVGETTRFDQTTVTVDEIDTPLATLNLTGTYSHEGDTDDDFAERAVPVEWIHTEPRERAIWRNGMFADENTAAKLRQQFTIEQVIREFGIED